MAWERVTRREVLGSASVLPLGFALPEPKNVFPTADFGRTVESHQRATRVPVDDPLITLGHGNPVFHDASNWPRSDRDTTYRRLRDLHPDFFNQRRILGQRGPPFHTGIPVAHRNGIDFGAEMGLPTTSTIHWLWRVAPSDERPVDGQLSGWLASLPDDEQWVGPDGNTASDPIEATAKRHLDGSVARSRRGDGFAYTSSMFSPNTLDYAVLRGSQSILWGANVVEMDGAKRPIMSGGDFSEWAIQAFQDHLKQLTQGRQAELDIDDPASFDIRAYAREIDARIRNGESPDIAVTDQVLFEFYLMQHEQLLRFYDEFRASLQETAADVNSPISVLGNQFGGPYADDTNASVLMSRVFDVIVVEGPITIPDHPRKAKPHNVSYGAAIQSPRRKLTAACGRARNKPVVEHGFFHTRGAAEKDRSLETGRPYPTLVGLNVAETYANGSRRQLDLTGWSDQDPDEVAGVWIDPHSGEIPADLQDFADFLWLYETELRGTPAAKVGVVHSIPTLLAKARRLFGTDLVPERKSLYGFVRGLREAAIPSEYVIFGHPDLWDDSEARKRLPAYDALVCPRITAVTDAQFEALEAFIEQGGTIIHEGGVATRDSRYRLRDRQLPSSGLLDTAGDAEDAVPNGDVEPLIEAFDDALPSRQVTLDTGYPLTAEVTRTDDSLIVHLLNYDYELEPDSVTPRSDVDVSVRLDGFEPQTARIVAPGAEPIRTGVERRDGRVQVTVPRVGIWTMVILDEEPRHGGSHPTAVIDAADRAIGSARSEDRTDGLIEAEASLREARLAADAEQFERARERARDAEEVAASATAIPIVGIDTGHGQGDDFRIELFEELQESLEPHVKITLMEVTEYTNEQLSDVDVLLVPPPLTFKDEQYDVSESEIESVREFVEGGGGLAVFTRVGVDRGIDDLVGQFGISVDPQLVTSETGRDNSVEVTISSYRTQLTYQVPPQGSFSWVNAMSIQQQDVTAHIRTTNEASVEGSNGDQLSYPVLVSTEVGDGRVCCLSTVTPLTNLQAHNRVTLRNILRWAAPDEVALDDQTSPSDGTTVPADGAPPTDSITNSEARTETEGWGDSAPGFGFVTALAGIVTAGLLFVKRVLQEEKS